MARIYVGNLPMDVRERELDDIFYKFGRITDLVIKRPNRPPAFAFITFSHPRDADDAVRYRDGYDFDGGRLRVEMMKSGNGGQGGGPPPDVTRMKATSNFRVFVFGLPKTASWQDLKDHFKKSCDVSRTDVDRTGQGLVEFRTERDMEDGLRLDGSYFANPFDEVKIKVMEDKEYLNGGKRRSRSRSGGRGRSRSRSKERGRGGGGRDSYSRSRSRDRKSRSRSRDRKSRSRSPAKGDKPSQSPRKVEKAEDDSAPAAAAEDSSADKADANEE